MLKTVIGFARNALGWNKADDFDIGDYISDEEYDENITALIDDLHSAIRSEETVEVEEPPPQTVAAPTAPALTTQYRKGKITRLSASEGVIDGKYYFDRAHAPQLHLEVGKLVSYHAYRNSEEQQWRVINIITVHDESWSDEEDCAEVPAAPVPENEIESDEDNVISTSTTAKRTIAARVTQRDGRECHVRHFVQMLSGGTKTRDSSFNLDNVNSDFTPLAGDLLNINAHVELSEETVDGSGEVVKVISIAPCRARRDDDAKVTFWSKNYRRGHINNDIYFERDACEAGYIPKKDDEVSVEAIECERPARGNDPAFRWRALSVRPINLTQHFDEDIRAPRKFYHVMDPDLLQNKGNIVVQEMTDFGRFPTSGNFEIGISISNENETKRTIRHWIDTFPSHLRLLPPHKEKVVIEPQETVTLCFKYNQSMLGFFSENFMIQCMDFQIGRIIRWEVFDPTMLGSDSPVATKTDEAYKADRFSSMKKFMDVTENRHLIRGVHPVKTPSFVKYRFPPYPIPKEIKSAMTSGSEGMLVNRRDSDAALKKCCPELGQSLSSTNHLKRFHSLLSIAEVDGLIDICRYTKERVHFVRRGQSSEYLALEMPGLVEGRPSVIVGDSVIVSSSWQSESERANLQGIVHKVTHDEVWLKFDSSFHNSYNSEDYDVFFQLARSCFRRCHFALDRCHANQANLWLFPKGVKTKPPQIALREPELYALPTANENENSEFTAADNHQTAEKFFSSSPQKSESVANGNLVHVKDVENSKEEQAKTDMYGNCPKELNWINKRLNHRQKEAVRNILLGEARPLPYVIFGPPGTGKTMTLVETILQIYSLRSESRLLVATPSNSSANLIAERLLASGLLQPGDMTRLVAFHLVAEGKIPVDLVPYCATLNISSSIQDDRELDSAKVGSLHCQLIMTRRIVVGTCVALGQMMSLDLPRGHFTHIVVDEAGQATEPEILIPLSFMAHESGQAILAGDPNQLGPVVQSNTASSLGLGKSLLARMLPRFPYQRDITGFPDSGGYDPRLVTRLTANYRSLPDILELPSSLFYDGDLDAMVSEEDSYEAKLLKRATESLQLPHSAVVFQGLKGSVLRGEDSPSFWNPQESMKVIVNVRQLLKAKIKCEDIGIITPYQKQASKIKRTLEMLAFSDSGDDIDIDKNVGAIKVGSVEEFQGQERMVIILSTVRSTGSQNITQIGRNTTRQLLGFVSNPERLNVAISRARALLIVCGDPEALCLDPYWRSVVRYCIEHQSYTGVGVPKHLLND